jgi:hypothetical protein
VAENALHKSGRERFHTVSAKFRPYAESECPPDRSRSGQIREVDGASAQIESIGEKQAELPPRSSPAHPVAHKKILRGRGLSGEAPESGEKHEKEY